jgi:polyferredoxin
VRKAMGWFFVALFVLLPWLRYDGRQAVLFDLEHQQFHIFGATIWPQDLTCWPGSSRSRPSPSL